MEIAGRVATRCGYCHTGYANAECSVCELPVCDFCWEMCTSCRNDLCPNCKQDAARDCCDEEEE